MNVVVVLLVAALVWLVFSVVLVVGWCVAVVVASWWRRWRRRRARGGYLVPPASVTERIAQYAQSRCLGREICLYPNCTCHSTNRGNVLSPTREKAA